VGYAINTYVMSDIHGCYDEMQTMLRKINFTEKDQLIIAGDYVDRGLQSYEMLCWMENVPDNILLIKGNHDAEFAYNIGLVNLTLKANNLQIQPSDVKETKMAYELTKQLLSENKNGELFDYYGTLGKLIVENSVSLKRLNEWKSIIDNMPYLFKTRVNGRRYIIVHAGYIDRDKLESVKYSSLENFYLYARDEAYLYGGTPNTTVISGHTPTISKTNISYNNGFVFKKIDENRNCIFYNIDCGCAYKAVRENAQLACIRLEDEAVFYV
jgi:serine/threonine protein phosphatase 1